MIEKSPFGVSSGVMPTRCNPPRFVWCSWLSLAVLALALFGCPASSGGSGSEGDKRSAKENTSGASSTKKQVLEAKSEDGADRIRIELDGQSVTIEGADAGKITGKPKSGKRRYESDGKHVATVKGGNEKFKLYDQGGKLLWKVKLKPNKVKISDNEEGDNAFSIKPRDDGFKLKRNDGGLGRVKVNGSKIKVKGGDGVARFRATGDSSASWAVLLIDTIPAPQRFVIMAEISARGR